MYLFSFVAVLIFVMLRLFGSPEISEHLPGAYGERVVHFIGIGLSIAIAFFIDRNVRFFYWNGYLRRKRKQDTPALIEDIVTIALVVLGVSFGLFFEEGVSFTGLLTASGATAIILGIALQSVIQDLFSGLTVNFDGSYSLGDWLTVYSDQFPESKYGRVTGITWRITFLQLDDGTRLMIPNRLVQANPVMNHSRPRGPKRLSINVPVDNRFPAERAKQIVLGEAFRASRQKGLASFPEPEVLLTKITSDSIEFDVRFYSDPDEITPEKAQSLMAEAVHTALLRHALPAPVTQVELTQPPNVDFGRKELEEALAKVPMFENALEKDQIASLAANCSLRVIPDKTTFIRQGDEAASMFVIIEGAARVSRTDDGESRDLAILVGGDIVGEMSLMTGAPRTATVTSVSNMRALEVTKEAIEPLLHSRPELLERFSQVLAARQLAIAQRAQRAVSPQATESAILARMREFFQSMFWA